jgi:hypothetical protein
MMNLQSGIENDLEAGPTLAENCNDTKTGKVY